MTTTTAIRCWHFAAGKLRDGKTLPKAGETLTHDGPVVPCESGYHGSVRAIDALEYAPGPFVSIRDLSGTVESHGSPIDKYAASEASHPFGYVDATNLLHRFACWCATQALDNEEKAGRKVDPRSREAIRVKYAWLDGEVDDSVLAAARAAAGDAARAAAGAAAGAAAWAAAWAAAGAAAGDAAGDAARAAAGDAAWDAAGDAAWDAAGAAAWDAAWAAGWDAARAAQNTELEHLLTELLEASK